MVTKRDKVDVIVADSSVLAKILMVTKLVFMFDGDKTGSVLAKILMVTKPQKYGSTFLNVIEY